MKGRRMSRTTGVVLLCWLLVAAAVFYLAQSSRQITLTGESEHWRAALAVPRPKDFLRDTVEDARFVLTWTGSREEYRQYRTLEYSYRAYGGGGIGGRQSCEEAGRLSPRITVGNGSISWAFWHDPRVWVSVSLDGGPPEEFVLTIK